jgi:hypothetical protein
MHPKQGLPRLPAAAACASPGSPVSPSSSAYTPRKYLKVLAHVLKTLAVHHTKLSVDFLGALKVGVVEQPAAAAAAAGPLSQKALGWMLIA